MGAQGTVMRRRLIRRLALPLILVLGFAQGAVAFAGCAMERGSATQMMASGECCNHEMQEATDSSRLVNLCLAHCTSDLQIAEMSCVLVRAAGEAPLFVAVPSMQHRASRTPVELPPPRSIAARILLHSFLI